ncbi:MAG: hypothetical protein Q4G43_14460, partial [Mobilicoccus sp.]|nr:hypothetical protein [Mobilicoccus sp.]
GPTSGLGVHGVSPLMATSHLLATVVLAWLLCGHAGTSVRVVLDRLLGVLLAGPTPARPPAWTPVIGHPMARVSQEIRAGLSLRGPPAATLR